MESVKHGRDVGQFLLNTNIHLNVLKRSGDNFFSFRDIFARGIFAL